VRRRFAVKPLAVKPIAVFVAVLAASGTSAVMAQMSEESARQAAQEVKLLFTEGANVIGDLQPAINGGKAAKEQVEPDVLVGQFRARYQKAAGSPFDARATGVVGDARRAYLHAYTSVVTRYQGVLVKGGQDAFVPAFFRAQVMREFNQQMQGRVQAFSAVVTRYQNNLTKGGQDAFVPAFFRAQVLGEFNKQMQGKVQVYATNRDNELINGDWAVHKVMKGSPLAGEVEQMMKTGALDPVVRRSGNTVMGYYPMKLGAACVACHAQNGLKQTEGNFGGALVAEIPVK